MGLGVTAGLGQIFNILPFAPGLLSLLSSPLGIFTATRIDLIFMGWFSLAVPFVSFSVLAESCEAGLWGSSFFQGPWSSWSDTFQSHQVGETQALNGSCPSKPVVVLCLVCPAEDPHIAFQLEDRALAFPAFISIW